jgi:16S rRNA (cytosine967-C5)-methyltransferase
LRLLNAVLLDRRTLADAAPALLEGLAPDVKARANRLALETLRKVGGADRILIPRLRKPPPPIVRNLLRMAVFELLEEGAAAHGVVNDAVNIIRSGRKASPMGGMVNAVLRGVAADGAADWAAAAPQRLPKWLRGRLISAYGDDRVRAMEAAHEQGAPLDLTPKDGDAAALAAQVGGNALPTGSVRLTRAWQVSALDGYEAGDWWVQDAASALPVKLLRPLPKERVLDLCAAPGGKTMQIAASGATVAALDHSEERLERVRENLSRTRLQADIVVADALEWKCETPFDAVLLDAPCSATGTIRRHPDLPFSRDGRNLREIFAAQRLLFDRAVGNLRPGGRMVYCTCSLLPEEGEQQVVEAMKRHDCLSVETPAASWIEDNWRSAEGGLRLTPEIWSALGGLDGFYLALIRKAA